MKYLAVVFAVIAALLLIADSEWFAKRRLDMKLHSREMTCGTAFNVDGSNRWFVGCSAEKKDPYIAWSAQGKTKKEAYRLLMSRLDGPPQWNGHSAK